MKVANLERNLKNIDRRADRAIQNVVRWTAWDVQRAAKTSIKSGGKNRGAKSWQTSKPGEPPRSHVGTLKQAIRVEKESATTYVVGPEKRGNGSALKALEHGGPSAIRATYYSEEYVARVKKAKRAAAKAKREDLRVRPKTARPYTLYMKNNPRGVRVTEYQYFYSREAWERARQSQDFQLWTSGVRQTLTTSIRIAARPYMAPALVRETSATKTTSRIARAFK